MKIRKLLYLFVGLVLSITVFAQGPNPTITKKAKLTENQLKRWSHLDLEKDSIPGMSIDRVYGELLKGKKGQKVIVGVVDSGVDIEHEDLKSVVWTNKKEIPNNGIDDDKNGYIDDVHGWNFLGNIENENLELTRMLKKADDGSQAYKDAKADYDKKMEGLLANKQQIDVIFEANKVISTYLKKEDFTIDEIKAITTEDAELKKSIEVFTKIGRAGAALMTNVNKFKTQVYNQLNYNYNLEYDGRKLVGDNPNDINDKNYGNNIVYGPTKEGSLHGTHVAGIIAQSRNNNLGGDGIADNVEIMSVRAVPNGDEYDKDIALAIRYAVDNGAKVINASFGKNYSPQKQWVYDAIKYAESKDVLIVHAAGNDSKDIDVEPNFPNDSDDKKTEFADNVITVGALNFENGKKIIANFSNYGKMNVDVYAPGVKIYATTPNGEYQYLQGTSMASPNVAGVAAMVRSYYPNLSAKEVKGIIMNSGTTISEDVVVGGDAKDVLPFNALSKSGKIVNGFTAMTLAEKMSKEKKETKKFPKKSKMLKN
ncbi:peptidase S8 [Flavobacterium amnicola]|uniref:Peptidase S8 n=1 Tax=Flavobacterium amnicola TaxID=2506422 RepID=A0A4Q1K3V8_9FLAO|nr:S8 family peptidase [Flavobacterium amnicola]RXR20506.1 peptidase S8 [Flavobacterium amnicola]